MQKNRHLSGLSHHHDENCGCGHHHEHHHDESCGCGHHHEHHHDESCGCGHHHEHHHDESCSCGHHHSPNQVMIGRMSGHLIGTMTAYTTASLPVCEVNMNLSMKDTAMFIKEQGGVPMQMKASLKDSSHTVVMNMLGKDIYRSESAESTETATDRVKCNLLAVADGIEPEVLRSKLEEIMGYFVNNAF